MEDTVIYKAGFNAPMDLTVSQGRIYIYVYIILFIIIYYICQTILQICIYIYK